MSIGTFGSFTQARLAIYAAQTGLTVTGNNISNINTPGYTRQRLDQTSLYTAGSDRYYAQGDVRVGQGVLVNSISQIRSPYLDIRFRKENASLGYMDGKLEGLDSIAAILDEVGKGESSKDEEGFGILGLELDKIRDALEQLTKQIGHDEYDNSVRKSAEALCIKLNSYANRLQEVYDETVTQLHQDVDEINGILTNIRNLNEEIRKCDIHGDPALELRDERNLQIDQLSGLIGIQVDYSMEEFSYGVEIEKLTIRLGNANPDGGVETDSSILVDGLYAGQLILEQVPQTRKPDPDDPTTMPYLDEDGNPVMTAEEAGFQLAMNPGRDPDQPSSATNPWYVDENGQGTELKENAKILKELNPDRNPDEANGPDNPWYLDADGNPTEDETKAANAKVPNPDYKPYLNSKGVPTADVEEARMVDSPNYNITVSELRNKVGTLHYVTTKSPEVKLTDAAEIQKAIDAIKAGGTITEKNTPTTSDVTITTYRSAAIGNPDWARYKPYLNDKGEAVGDIKDAEIVDGKPRPNPAHYPYVSADGQTYSMKPGDGFIENTAYQARYLKEGGGSTNSTAEAQKEYFMEIYVRTASKPVELDDNDLNGRIQAHRELLTEAGEFIDKDVVTKDSTQTGPYRNADENASSKRGIVYYQKSLDLLANQFANAFNEANQGFRYDPDGYYITTGVNDQGKEVSVPVGIEYQDGAETKTYYLNKNDSKSDVPAAVWQALEAKTGLECKENVATGKDNSKEIINAYLSGQVYDDKGKPTIPEGELKHRGIFDGGVLFSNHNAGDDPTGITASNISISHTWSNTTNLLVNSFECPVNELEPASGANGNILHMVYLMNQKMDYVPNVLPDTGGATDEVMFTGDFYEMFNKIGSTLGEDQKLTSTMGDTHYQNALAIDTNRDSVSSVDFNDEAMNLMMYAKSYNAACRLMTTIDSVLDKLVNNTGVTT